MLFRSLAENRAYVKETWGEEAVTEFLLHVTEDLLMKDTATLKNAGVPEDAVQHSLEVARKCLEIASRVKIPVEKHLLARGALFHDLGKAKSHGLDHGEIGAQMAVDLGLDEAIRQIISNAVVSDQVVDIFDAVGLDKPNIGLLDDEFLAQVKNLPEKNLAVELLERLLEGEIKSRFGSNVVQEKKFSDLLGNVIKRYQNRSIETAQVMEELVEMARKFRQAASRGEQLGLSDDEVRFYDALANNESAVKELNDETLKKIAHELTENLRQNITVDWAQRESVRAKLRLMVKRILRKYKYPPDQQEGAVELVLQQAKALGEAWMAA